MILLAFDTCFDGCSVCVAEQQGDRLRVLSSAMERFETGHAARLVPMIGEAVQQAGIDFNVIGHIAVTTGPGTFTGTRIGIAAARAIALATDARTTGISSLAVMAEVARREIDARTLAVVVDARRGEVYAQLFDAEHGAESASPPQLLSVADAAELGGSHPVVFVGSAAEQIAATATEHGRDARAALPDLLPDAVALAHVAVGVAPSDAPLLPFYLRPPDARPQEGKTIARV
ncbi:putative chaperone protein [Hyphomicrobium sulfonivorans]|uniref:Putative chaperone protein n=1 Tax=Hyphomicrobium sulfonivorans TaxID=121290 RepID=A0A109BE20_HYPSL|nr:tRNA (adenosine(37)-N6)-threonylcarbamoyltransferase complex dimerization subunit type 1 TsaB [Hyphomicrobium sulfonivorans]KWT67056.1 putative chaperone protein [Hyphomicrobium sulfonivorans]